MFRILMSVITKMHIRLILENCAGIKILIDNLVIACDQIMDALETASGAVSMDSIDKRYDGL